MDTDDRFCGFVILKAHETTSPTNFVVVLDLQVIVARQHRSAYDPETLVLVVESQGGIGIVEFEVAVSAQ